MVGGRTTNLARRVLARGRLEAALWSNGPVSNATYASWGVSVLRQSLGQSNQEAAKQFEFEVAVHTAGELRQLVVVCRFACEEGGHFERTYAGEVLRISPAYLADGEAAPSARGRPSVGHEVVLRLIWFVLDTGCRWKEVSPEMGCCGETARTRLHAWERAGLWDELHQLMSTLLRQVDAL